MAITLPFYDKWVKLGSSLQEEWGSRYAALQAREQSMIKIAAILLPCIVVWFGVVLPLQDKKDALQTHVATLTVQAVDAERFSALLQQQKAITKPQAATGSLLSQMDALANAQGVRQYVTQMRPQSGMDGKQRLRLMMKKIPYAQAVGFLLAMDQQQIVVKKMKLQQDTSSGYVQLQLLLENTE